MTFPLTSPQRAREPRAQRAERRRHEREVLILDAALVVAERGSYLTMTRRDVAREAGVSNGLINHAFVTMDALRGAVMRAAIERENIAIVRQGIAAGDDLATNCPPELREAVARSIA
jgi:AcrR family transcriptional regulator